MNELISRLAGTLIVSCQAYPGEPMRHPETMAQVAQSAAIGGASAIRAQGIEDLRAIKATVDLPLIGLWKDGKDGVFITPTLEHAIAVVQAGSDVVALDGTVRERPDGLTFAETVRRLREQVDTIVMADCDSVEAALAAAEAGADIVGTTLAGYTPARAKTPGPDLELLAELTQALPGIPVIAEGRIHTPAAAAAALAAGAHAVVVGTAITHPASITSWFVDAVDPQRTRARR